MKFQAIVFDFDGVLVESVDVKGRAFYDLYEDSEPEIRQQALEYHLAHGGISRYDKIRYYEREFFGREANEADVQVLAQRFSDLVEEKVVAADYVPGAKDFIDQILARGMDMFVASGTPQEELERIVEKRGMRKYFKSVYGSPIKKAVHLNHIISEHGFDPKHLLMIGDALSDYEAAQVAGTEFIGRLNPDAPVEFAPDVSVLDDLTTLTDIIDG